MNDFQKEHLCAPYSRPELPTLPTGRLYILARSEREARDYIRAQEDKVGHKVDFRHLCRPEHFGGLLFHTSDEVHLVGYYREARESEYMLAFLYHRGSVRCVEVPNWR